MYFINEKHKDKFIEAMAMYKVKDYIGEKPALLYCLSALDRNISNFVDDSSWALCIRPEALNGGLSSGEYKLVSLAYHLFTGVNDYVVPENDFCSFDSFFFEVAIQAIRIRAGVR